MKYKRYQVVTALLIAYALFMTVWFGRDLLASGHTVRFVITALSEAACITLAFFAMRKRDRNRDKYRK